MVRIASTGGRSTAVVGALRYDLATVSAGRFGADPQALFPRWDELSDWWASTDFSGFQPVPEPAVWSNPVPEPRQVVAIGMSYPNKRSGLAYATPTKVAGVAKLFSSLAGPEDDLVIDSDDVVLDAEITVVIKNRALRVSEETALRSIAGVTLALDVVDKNSVLRLDSESSGRVTYLNPGKSRPGFTPVGPVVVGLDEVADLDDLDVELTVNGTLVQAGNTGQSLFSVAEIVSRLSHGMELLPGDLILLGGPGNLPGRPVVPLAPGDDLLATAPVVGRQHHTVRAAPYGIELTSA